MNEKAGAMLDEALRRDMCSPGQASKIRGVMGFMFTGAYGEVGRGGQTALLQRQYKDRAAFSLSAAPPEGAGAHVGARIADLRGASRPPLVVASDGRVDEPGPRR